MDEKEQKEQNERAKLEAELLKAQTGLEQAKTTQGYIKERQDELAAKMYGAVTPDERASFEAQLADNRPKLENANQNVLDREGDLKAIHEREARGDQWEGQFQQTSKGVENLVGAATMEGGPLSMIDTGGTPIGDVVAYASHVTAPYVIAAVEAKGALFASSLGSSPEHAERRNIEGEIKQHNEHMEELDKLANDFKADVKQQREEDARDDIELSDRNKAIQIEFEVAAENAKQAFERQNTDMNAQERDAQDPNVRTTQKQVRETMAEEMNAKRDEVTRELCRPVAEINVDERNARTLENSDGLNKAHLERYKLKVANEPDGKERVERFAGNLAQSQKDLKTELHAERPQAVEKEITTLQHQHFPEIQTQAIQGPSLQPSGPAQPGSSGGSLGSSSPSGGAPQQQGPPPPAM